jgi:hypothetical protein
MQKFGKKATFTKGYPKSDTSQKLPNQKKKSIETTIKKLKSGIK